MRCLYSNGRAAGCGCSQQSRATGNLLAAVRQPPRCLWTYRPSRAANQLTHQQRETLRIADRLQTRAGPVDAPPIWTLDQIAGLAFGALMVVFYFSATAVDIFVAKQQRRELGLCEECGGIYDAETCTQRKCPLKGKQ